MTLGQKIIAMRKASKIVEATEREVLPKLMEHEVFKQAGMELYFLFTILGEDIENSGAQCRVIIGNTECKVLSTKGLVCNFHTEDILPLDTIEQAFLCQGFEKSKNVAPADLPANSFFLELNMEG